MGECQKKKPSGACVRNACNSLQWFQINAYSLKYSRKKSKVEKKKSRYIKFALLTFHLAINSFPVREQVVVILNLHTISKAGIETFSYGVFTIIITLLILPLHDALPKAGEPNFGNALLKTISGVLVYIRSFLITGIYWLNHHYLFNLIQQVNTKIIWLNMLHLMFISFFSISTALVGRYPLEPLSASTYGVNLLFANLSSFLIIKVLQANPKLVSLYANRHVFAFFNRYYPAKGGIYLVAVLVGFRYPFISCIVYFIVNLVLIALSFCRTVLSSNGV